MRLCCKGFPIILDGELVFVCNHRVPRALKYHDGILVSRRGRTILLQDCLQTGVQYTDAYGMLNTYSVRGLPEP